MARDDPRCLPSTRTLRRIRWPLQPRSRDRRAPPFDDVATAGRRSHAVLGLSRSFTNFLLGEGRLTSHRFARHFQRRSRAADRASLGPRSLLPPLFFERCVRAYSGPDAACRLLQRNHDVRTLSSGLPFPRRDDGHDHLPFLTPHARPSRITRTQLEKR
jgi:hypothetical protein